MLFGHDIDLSGDTALREALLARDEGFAGAAGVTSFLRAKREATNVVHNNTVECTTWAKEEDPSLGVPRKADAAPKLHGLRRNAAGEGGRPAEHLGASGGVAQWVQEHRSDDAPPGFDEARKSGVSYGGQFYHGGF